MAATGIAAAETAKIHQHHIGSTQQSIQALFPGVGVATEFMHSPAPIVIGLVLDLLHLSAELVISADLAILQAALHEGHQFVGLNGS